MESFANAIPMTVQFMDDNTVTSLGHVFIVVAWFQEYDLALGTVVTLCAIHLACQQPVRRADTKAYNGGIHPRFVDWQATTTIRTGNGYSSCLIRHPKGERSPGRQLSSIRSRHRQRRRGEGEQERTEG